MFRKCFTITKATAGLALAALLLVGQADGQQNSLVFPWNSGNSGYKGYNEPRYATQPLSPAVVPAPPSQYQLYVTTLPEKSAEDPNAARLMAHVAANALIWIEGEPTTSTGDMRTFISSPLKEGKKYTYTVRVDWIEDGKQVSQTQEVPVKAGGIHCFYLVKAGSKIDPKTAAVEENLAKLSPEDRELAKSQKYCAVQEGVRLGAHGVPVKVMLNKQSVLLCCEACVTRAEKDAAKTLAKVKELKAKPETPPGN